jgi:anti-sigma factor RsiW
MSCKLSNSNLLNYIDGDLDTANQQMVKEHLENCLECHEKLVQLKSMYGIIEIEKQALTPNPFLSSRIWEKVNQVNVPIIPLRRFTIATIAAAGLTIGIVIGSLFYSTSNVNGTTYSEQAWQQLADDYFPGDSFSPYENIPQNQ